MRIALSCVIWARGARWQRFSSNCGCPSTAPYRLLLPGMYYVLVGPVAYQVILEPGIGQFREFESTRVHTRIHSKGLYLMHQLTCGKRESVS